jgi:hypothetical protein
LSRLDRAPVFLHAPTADAKLRLQGGVRRITRARARCTIGAAQVPGSEVSRQKMN